jgi:SAM-dependent methyltransferase
VTGWAQDYFEHGYLQRWLLGPPSEDTHRDTQFLADHLQLARHASVLDIACGHGRYALAFAQRGAIVTGVDFAANLLALAQQHASALQVSVGWIRADMRALPIRRGSVHAATLLDAFGFFDTDAENVSVLREIARVLVPGGHLALEVVNAEPIQAGFRSTDREEHDGIVVDIKRTVLTEPSRLVEDLEVCGPRGAGQYQRRQRLYSVAEITGAMAEAGVEVVSVFGGFGGETFHAESSSTMVIIAQVQDQSR